MSSELCPRCDKQKATQRDYDHIPEGEGDHLCWAPFGSECEPVDWRARYLHAMGSIESLKTTIRILAHGREEEDLLKARMSKLQERNRELEETIDSLRKLLKR